MAASSPTPPAASPSSSSPPSTSSSSFIPPLSSPPSTPSPPSSSPPCSSSTPFSPPSPPHSSPSPLLFLLSSLSSLLLPNSPLPPLLLLSSFLSHFLFLSLSRSDSSSIDSHYFSLLLLPALILTLSSLISISRPKSKPPRIARAAGLALEGTWLLQMGVSLFSSWGMASGCFLKRRSWAEYTVKCKGHMEYHRARAIGTLQFNCHLALMVVAAVGVYGVLNSKAGGGVKGYAALGKEMEMVEESGERLFTLDSDNEEEAVVVVAEARNGAGEVH